MIERVGAGVIPTLLTAGGLVGFVAFAGSVIVWTRFWAAGIPPDQVVAAYPRGELVAIASSLLLLFGFVGVLAVIAFFLINKESGSGIGYMRALLVLLGVEGIVAIYLVEGSSTIDRILACALFALPAVIAFWATFLSERPDIGSGDEASANADGDWTLAKVGNTLERYLLKSRFVSLALGVTLTVIFLFLVSVFAPRLFGGSGLPVEQSAIAGLGVIAIVPSAYLIFILINDESGERRELKEGEIPFSHIGQAFILILPVIAAVGPSLVLGSGWLPFALGAAAVLVAGLWRVAVMTHTKFFWYALAVFISVPLFGTVTLMFRNVAEPEVQPMALIRQGDGPDESIQGIYVTETDDRIYFANVATEGCTKNLVPHSGRLLWVPKSEVVALSVGPLQNVEDAAKSALEMSYALTPAVETPAGDHVSLTEAEKREVAQRGAGEPEERRLENPGAAVQPNFGAGLRLLPENASPGELVTLRMSAPNRQPGVNGFGTRREGRTLRLGGVPVDIAQEEAHAPFDAEYVEGQDGQALTLAKGVVYVENEGEYREASTDANTTGDRLFVKIGDPDLAEVYDQGLAHGNYLLLADGDHTPPRLALSHGRSPIVALKDGTLLTLKARLLRQDWHEDHIRFRVPPRATTGAVTVECEQLAGQPLLRVNRPPLAKIKVKIEPGSRRVVFDSSSSVDNNGRIVSRHWLIEGLDRGSSPRIEQNLPPSEQSYIVQLKVTDSEGQTGRAELRLLRIPARQLDFKNRQPIHPGLFKRIRQELRHATASEPATAIEFEMRPGEGHRPPNPNKTIRAAERARHALLRAQSAQTSSAPANPEGLTVKTVAFGGKCPAEHASGQGRLDVLVLGKGTQAVPPDVCPVLREKTAHWLLPPP